MTIEGVHLVVCIGRVDYDFKFVGLLGADLFYCVVRVLFVTLRVIVCV